MHRGFASRIFVAALAGGALTACNSAPVKPAGSNVAGASVRPVAEHPHWTRTSLGTFSDPYGVAVKATCAVNCDVYVADPGSKTIWKVAPDGSRSSVGSWYAAGSSFDPQSVAVDTADRVWVADKGTGGKDHIWEVLPDGRTEISSAFVPLGYPRYFRGVGVGYALTATGAVSDIRVLAVAATHEPLSPAKNGAYYANCCGLLRYYDDPYGVAGDGKGDAYIADARSKHIYIQRWKSGFVTAEIPRPFVDPYGVAVTLDGRYIYVADAGDKRVWELAPDGLWSVVGSFADPYSVAVDASGTVYVADPGSKNVWKLTQQ